MTAYNTPLLAPEDCDSPMPLLLSPSNSSFSRIDLDTLSMLLQTALILHFPFEGSQWPSDNRSASLPLSIPSSLASLNSRESSSDSYDMLIGSGNGPSALILSYLLHGHIPSYNTRNPHPDPILHEKLLRCSELLRSNLWALTDHFASSLRYSSQALPINILLDTLLRPNADTTVADTESRLKWIYRPDLAIPHVVLGNASRPGGQWVDNPVAASCNVGTLSYAEMLSLPGYSYADHYLRTHDHVLPSFTRPSRRDVADYFAAYPTAVGIEDSVFNHTDIKNVSRDSMGFLIGSHNIRCKHLVLASGTLSFNIAPPPLLRPLATLRSGLGSCEAPLLVIGSGFTAADVIISTPPQQNVLHLFRWAPDIRPSPLRGCHQSAYPEYAAIYRRMKLVAIKAACDGKVKSPLMRRKPNPFFSEQDLDQRYEGMPNAEIMDLTLDKEEANVVIRLDDGSLVERRVSGLAYVVGRRGSLSYLDPDLLAEVLGPKGDSLLAPGYSTRMVSGRSLREKAETDLEIAPKLFIIGSLTGDSLIRFAYGGCVYAASKIMGPSMTTDQLSPVNGEERGASVGTNCKDVLERTPMNRVDEHSKIGVIESPHIDLHLDRPMLDRSIDMEHKDTRRWRNSVDRRDGLIASCGV
ncbi:MAG: hypothetical protein M1836_001814 [Candelina mexicana]|nr:MAG: hypothetical protein M1836_001814 [Candelina mexicana]